MKKVYIFCLIIIFCSLFIGITTASAETLSDWIDSGSLPEEVENGIRFTGKDIRDIFYAVYKKPLDVKKGITVEITPEYCEDKTINDAWISVSFMSTPSLFNLTKPIETPGFVALYYNYNGVFRVNIDGYMENIYESRNTWRLLQKGTPLKVGERNTIELKWKESEEGDMLNLFINGKQMDNESELALIRPDVMFAEGKAYVMLGTYASGGKPAIYTIHRINDTRFGKGPEKQEATTVEKTDNPDNASSASTETNAPDDASSTAADTDTSENIPTAPDGTDILDNGQSASTDGISISDDASSDSIETDTNTDEEKADDVESFALEDEKDSKGASLLLMTILTIAAIAVISVIVFVFIKSKKVK